MTDLAKQLSEYTLHVVLATLPQTQEKAFDHNVKKEFYENYRNTCKKYLSAKNEQYGLYPGDLTTPVLYNPLRYIIFGNYDIAYITLIDSFKFAQRLFEPKEAENDDLGEPSPKLFAPHTFQSFTGIAHHSTAQLQDFFYEHLRKEQPVRKAFLGICNLKLNNGFLIGNGINYLNAVLSAIDNEFASNKEAEYLKLQSFSWFEISLLIFSDDPQQIANIIQLLRRLTMSHLLASNPEILEESLYQCLFPGKPAKFFREANIFADTHTYMGIHADAFMGDDDAYGDLLEKTLYKPKTEIEWQIKPGHLHSLAEMLNDHQVLKKYPIPKANKHFLAGRSDYCLKSELNTIGETIRLLRMIISGKTKLFDHVRKLKTNIYFAGLKNVRHPTKEVIKLHEKLTSLAENMTEVAKVNRQMKALKLSRQIRSKILKIFSNYNNGVQDIVLFPYLLDFKIFIERLKGAIDEAHLLFMERFTKPANYNVRQEVDRLEDILMKMINIFQEGFTIRMLNPYQFEDINDFDLDFNSSIQQLLSVFSTLAFEIGNQIYTDPYTYGPVIQLNLKDTVSNDSSINYYVNHLTSPEFVFATITKEIINALPKDDEELEKIIQNYQDKKPALLKKNPVIRDLDERGLINISYFFNDAFRYVWTYNMDFPLFYYWFWTYNFQNASLYNEMGLMDESHFEKELFRILFIAKFFKTDHSAEVTCPLPEIASYWERHYIKIEKAVTAFIRFLDGDHEDETMVDIESLTFAYLENMEKSFNAIMERGEKESPLTQYDDGGALLLDDIEKQYGKQLNIGDKYTLRLGRRSYLLKQKDTLPIELVKKDSVLYLEWYIWRYLNRVYKINKGKISLVRRNWENGEPMVAFVYNNDAPNLYSVDQTGGLFFESMEQQGAYFQESCKVLLDLWDFSLLRKKKFIEVKLGLKTYDTKPKN